MEALTGWPWPWPSLLLLLTTLSVSLLFLLRGRRGARKKATGGKEVLPPGPPALLFLAKFLALRRSIFDLGPLLLDLHARHGPVVSVRLFSRTFIFVADRRVAHHVLVQGGAVFAGRTPLVDPGPLFTAGSRDISTSPYGAYWRLVRRNLAAEALHPARVALFAPARRRARDALVRDLLHLRASTGGAVAVRASFRRAMFELLVYMSLGARLEPAALDEVQELQLRILRSITSFPVFAFFPALTKRIFRKRWAGYVAVRRRQDEIFLPLIHARRRGGGGGGGGDDNDPPCYADSLLALRVAEEGDRPLTDAEVVTLCSEFLNAGTDTAVTLLEWIMAELVNHPEMQSKVYEEVKSKPELSDGDLQGMPYLKAVVLEGLRLHPPAHFLLPHGVHGEDGTEISGYAVPKGAEVNFLVGEFGRDEAVWTAAREFRPERFLDGGEGHGVDVTGSREIKMMPFGAGRRMCPGYALGMLHLEYLVGSLVRELEWLPAAEAEGGVDMAEELDFTVVMKHPLRARIVPRS